MRESGDRPAANGTCIVWAFIAVISVAGASHAQPPLETYTIHLPGNAPIAWGLTPGPDGAMWYTVSRCDDPGCTTRVRHEAIGRVTTSGDITEFPVPFNAGDLGSGVYGIVAGPDDALWFTEIRGNAIGRMTTEGHLTTFSLASSSTANPYGITLGPDGALWFTESMAIGRINVAGDVTHHALGTIYGSDPTAIVAGPDGAMWFTEINGNRVGRLTTSGAVTRYTLPPSCAPHGIASGADGALWFTCFVGNAIGRITLDGALSMHHVPTADSGPIYLTQGPDGAMWFTEQNARQIGRIATDGSITEYASGPGNGYVVAITAGPDGIWFAKEGDIGHIVISRYQFEDFFLPPPALNRVRPGQRTIGIKFSLQGDHGLGILRPGYPVSVSLPCEGAHGEPFSDETVAAGALFFKEETGKYEYAWKTDPAWRGTCRRLIMQLDDNSVHEADFWFSDESGG